MSFSSLTNRYSISGDGATTDISIPVYFNDNADWKVYKVLKTDITDATLLAITTHYTVSGAQDPLGGTIVLTAVSSALYNYHAVRNPALTQTLDMDDLEPVPVSEIEKRLDLLTTILQRHAEQIAKALKFAEISAFSSVNVPELIASKYIAVNSGGTGLEFLAATDVASVRSGSDAVDSGVKTKSIVFSTTMGTTAYTVIPILANYTDSPIDIQPVSATVKSATGFTCVWSSETGSANYVLEWIVLPHN